MDENASVKKGGISVQTEHIFPVIKKWLYSEKEIFIRELVSNACDAVAKLRRLSSLGEFDGENEKYRITVAIDSEAKTLTISDNGIGMTEDEVQKYICNIALSGAVDFIKKYENGDSADGIIGHFGLGFYSAFMVADTVEIVTKSYTGAPTVHWICDESGDYTIEESETERTRGTDIIMHITDEGTEYLEKYKCREVLDKYCSFMPVEIFLEASDDKKDDESDSAEEKPINDTHPLWLKNAADCTDEEYKEFYHKLFGDMREPLFQIHINADYPLNFKGILYFPPIRNDYETLEGQVKLYYNQVFVADNLKEVIPEYLLLLRGVLDCPELPLNVSRSYLQNSGYVSKISAHIVKKVADKLSGMFNGEREKYESFWDDIRFFVEYGCLRDGKFYERVKNILLLKLTSDKYLSIDEYLEAAKEHNEGVVYYTSDKILQAQYVSMFEERGINVALLSSPIDLQFMSFIESKCKVKFMRVDSDIAGALRTDGEIYSNDGLSKLFVSVSGDEKLTVKFENLTKTDIPAVLNISEEERRFGDMMKLYSPKGESGLPMASTLVLNSQNSLIRKLGEAPESDGAKTAAKQVWLLALLAQRKLSANELKEFLAGSYAALEASLGES